MKFQLKRKAQSLYYFLRADGIDHAEAMGIVIDYVISAAVPNVATPVKPARIKKGLRGGK